jgi:small subunit ribosomal protein S17
VVKEDKYMERNLRKTKVGKVMSNKMDKTIVVKIDTKTKDPLYGKIVNKSLKVKSHDENNECSIGDTVEIMETRPLSKDKRYRLIRIVEKVK